MDIQEFSMDDLIELRNLFEICQTEEQALAAGILIGEKEFLNNPPNIPYVVVKSEGKYCVFKNNSGNWTQLIPDRKP
jgi:hypothetical protein